MKKSIIKKFAKFILGGVLGNLINLTVTFVLTDFFSIYYLVSYATGLITSILFNFTFAVKVIFNVKDQYQKRFITYLCFVFTFFVINLISVRFLTETLNFNYKLSVIFITGIAALAKYLIYDNIVFNISKSLPY